MKEQRAITKHVLKNKIIIKTQLLLGPPEDVSVLRTGQAHSGSVNDSHQLLNVFHQLAVDEFLVPLLDPHQVNVPGKSFGRGLQTPWFYVKLLCD